jgi:hypothetical protein
MGEWQIALSLGQADVSISAQGQVRTKMLLREKPTFFFEKPTSVFGCLDLGVKQTCWPTLQGVRL